MDISGVGDEAALWQRLSEAQDDLARSQLIERYLPLSRTIAATLYAKRVADDAEFSDYMQCATMGLIEAVDGYDWRRGVKFSTFASYRIQGSIRNSVANFSERREQVSLLYRLKKERLESIKDGAEGEARRRQRGRALLHEVADMTAIWALSFLLEDSGMVVSEEEAQYVEQFYDHTELRQLKVRLAKLVEALPDQERRVIKYHYFQNLEFTEIANMFRVTKGRISQIHKRALWLLREAHAMAGTVDVKI
jgi:RNA polymerase sigma factor for flagellar operon FliA